MADPSEILNIIAGQAAAIVYPNGTEASSISDSLIKIYPGWPVPAVMQPDIDAGGVHVSVYPLATERKLPTTIGRPFRVIDAGNPTTSASVNAEALLGIDFILGKSTLSAAAGASVTLSGTVSTPQNVYFLIDGTGYHYSVQSTDTLTSIATAMATLIPGASNSGAVISIPDAIEIVARVGGVGSAARELRRQSKEFMVSVWAPTPALRDLVGSALDSGLSVNSNLSLSDSLPAFMVYSRTMYSDEAENYHIYRRDLVYTITYATSQTVSAPQVVAPVMTTNTHIKNI